jgi:pyruvate dehydrogenase E1 component alpha subunit
MIHELSLWETMVLIRRVEETIARMIEAGEIACPCHLAIGQEAVAAGVCAALAPEDTIWGGHRSHGHYLAKGGNLETMLAGIRRRGGSMHLAAPEQGIPGTVPIVGATVPLAVGAAMAYKLRGEPRVAAAFFGDGALEEGHLHESMNLAALYSLPVLFVCENNLYASHLHWSERRAADNLYRAGEFHSVPGERVDGNDAMAVHAAADAAVHRARTGGGPSLLECRTFRWRGHVGPSYDLDVGVRRRDDLQDWLNNDPIRSMEARLTNLGVKNLAVRAAAIDARIEDAVKAARIEEVACAI